MPDRLRDLADAGHRARNLEEDVAHLVGMGDSYEEALQRLGINRNTFEKRIERR